MKGIVNVEFIIAVFVFLITLSFILINIGGNLAPLHRDIDTNDLRSKTYQLSQIIAFDEGDPKNWEASAEQVRRFGLSTGGKYIVSSVKIRRFGEICQPDILQGMFSTDSIRINITDEAGRTIASCGNVTSPEFSITRFAVNDARNIVGIEVSMK